MRSLLRIRRMAMPLAAGLLLLVAAVAPRVCAAQAAPVQTADFGTVAVGASAKTAAITFSFNASATVSAIRVGTQGSAGLDFTLAQGDAGTCATATYAAGASCTVNVNFVPTTAGLRSGAAVLFGDDGMPLAIQRVRGTGAGPVAVFNPGSVLSIPTILSNALAVAVDASGNRFVADTGSGRIVQITTAGAQSTVASGLSEPVAIAVDAAGDLLVADGALGQVLLFARSMSGIAATPVVIADHLSGIAGLAIEPSGSVAVSLGASRQVVEIEKQATPVVLASFAAGFTPGALVVDGQGNLLVSAMDAGAVVRIVPGGAPVTILSGLQGPAGLAVDAAGDIYVAERYSQDVVEFNGQSAKRKVLAKQVATNAVALEPDGSLAVVTAASALMEIKRNNATADFGPLANHVRLDNAVQNIGNAPLVLSSVQVSTLTAGLSGAFAQATSGVQDCTARETLAAAQSCSLALQATPPTHATTTARRISGQAQVLSNTLNALGSQSTLHMNAAGLDALVFTPTPAASVSAGTSPGVVTVSAESLGVVDTTNTSSITLTVTLPDTSSLTYNVAAVNGVATFDLTGVILTEAGNTVFTATDTVGDTGATATTQVLPLSVAAKIVVSGYPSSVLVGVAHNVMVTVEDAYNNVATGYMGTIAVSSSDSAAGISPASYNYTAADAGMHAFAVQMNTAGTQSISATNGSTNGTQQNISVTLPGTAALSVDALGTTAPVSTIARGNGVTLRAFMTKGGGGAVYPGTVTFVDLSLAAAQQTVGTAQLLTNGTAAISLTPALGTHTYRAIFNGTKTQPSSVSSSQSLAVTGTLGSAVTLAASGTPADYTLTATVLGYGFTTAPTGTVSFQDTTNSNAVVGTASLTGATFTTTQVAQPTVATGTSPGQIVIGDVNGDGIPDAVIANAGDGTLTVLLGNGDGTFAKTANVNAGGMPTSVVAGDFNNDGNLDLAVVDNLSGNIKIFLGNGDGTFTAGQVIAAGINPNMIAAGDLNNDGNLDLAVTLGGTNSVAILLGNGDGTFTAGTTVNGVGTGPTQVVIADFNHDGNADLAIGNSGLKSVTVELGAGDGTFSPAPNSPFAAGTNPVALAAADLNADGNLDLAVVNAGDSTVDILLGDGYGNFTLSGSPIAVGAGPNTIQAADFNNDGSVDLLTANLSGNTVSLLSNSGNGSFTATATIPAGNGSGSLAAADLNGDGRADLVVTNASDNTVSVFLTAQTTSVSVTNITFAATGSHLADAVYSGDSTYDTSTSNMVSLTSYMLATTTTLTASPVSPSVYGQTVTLTASVTPTLSYGVSIAGTVTFIDNGAQISAPITVSGGTVSLTLPLQALGGHVYMAVYSGSKGFIPSTSALLPYTVATSTVTVTAPAYSGPYGVSGSWNVTVTAPYTMTGQSVPTGTISYQFPGFTAQTATLVNGAATITVPAGLPVGTGTLTASYSGDTNYQVTTGTLGYTITGAPLTVMVDSATRMYGAANPTFTGTITGMLNGDTFTAAYSSVATAASTVGTYPITASVSGTNLANYSVTVVPGTLTVTAAPLTITAANASRTYGTANPTFSGSIAGAVNGDVLTLSFSTSATAASSVGTYPIVPAVNGAAAGNYTVTVVDGTLTVTALGITITADNATRLYGAVNPVFTGTITGAPANSGLTVTGTTTATQFSAVGTYAIVPVLSGNNAGNYTATAVNGVLTITQTPTTTLLVSSASSQVYGQSVTFTATVTPTTAGVPTGSITFRDGSLLLGTVTLANGTISLPTAGLAVGTHTITASYSGDTNFGASSSNSIAQVITKATLTVTVNNATRVYGAADPAFTSTVTGALPGDTFTVSYASNDTVTSGVGAYIITPTVTGAALANYNVIYVPGTLTITPAPLTITAANATRQYMAANPTFSGSVSGALNGDTFALTFTTTATATSDVGTYPIIPAASGTNLANYTVTVVDGTLTITPATGIVITAGNATRLYGTANPVFTGTVSGTFANLGLTVTGTTTATLTSDAGTYPIIPVLNGVNPADYSATIVDGVLTVAPAGTTIVLVSANPLAIVGANVNLTATVASATTGTPTGQVYFYTGTTFLGASPLSGGVASLTTNAIPQGSNALTARYNGNIDFTASTSNSVIETIQSNTLIVQVGNATKAYGTANPGFTSTITGALPGDTFSVSYSTTATTTSLPGSYVINATVAGANIGAYTVTVIPGVLTIAPQVLTATANSFTRAYGAANPTFTGTLSGAINGDVFTETFTTTATTSSLPGTYAIVPVVTGTNLANYTLSIVPGVLTITQTGATLLLQASSTTTAYGSPIVLTVVLTGQNNVVPTGNVLFYDGNILLGTVPSSNGIATLTVSTLAAGIHTLTAQSAGDANYGPTLSNTVVETITGTGSGTADYTVTASPASLTIKQGSTGSTVLTLTPINGYTGQLALNCLTLPQYASCAFNPIVVTMNGTTPMTVTLTISTSAKVSAVQEPGIPGRMSGIRYAGFAFLPAMLLAGVVCFRRRWVAGMRLTVLVLGVVTMLSLSGCVKVSVNGSSSGTGLTPVGTTTTTITVSPVSVTTGVYHTLPITLTVTQ
jgi:hypothetical protein